MESPGVFYFYSLFPAEAHTLPDTHYILDFICISTVSRRTVLLGPWDPKDVAMGGWGANGAQTVPALDLDPDLLWSQEEKEQEERVEDGTRKQLDVEPSGKERKP